MSWTPGFSVPYPDLPDEEDAPIEVPPSLIPPNDATLEGLYLTPSGSIALNQGNGVDITTWMRSSTEDRWIGPTSNWDTSDNGDLDDFETYFARGAAGELCKFQKKGLYHMAVNDLFCNNAQTAGLNLYMEGWGVNERYLLTTAFGVSYMDTVIPLWVPEPGAGLLITGFRGSSAVSLSSGEFFLYPVLVEP